MIWTILGFSVGIVAFFCIAVAETFVGKPIFEDNRLYIAGVFAAVGVASWFVGRYLGTKKRADENGEEQKVTSRFVLFDLRYWGPMCVTLGVIVLFIRPLKAQKTEVVAAPQPPIQAAPAVVPVVEVIPPAPKPPVTFPPLKIQGIIYRESQPVAIINGYSYAVGDRVGEAMVKSINPGGVVMELSGELKLLTLR
jgi:hypothetical protein